MSSDIDIAPCPYCKFIYPALVVQSQDVECFRLVSYAYVYCGECHTRGPSYHELEVSGYQDCALFAWNEVSNKVFVEGY
jgi:hypothetical protein